MAAANRLNDEKKLKAMKADKRVEYEKTELTKNWQEEEKEMLKMLVEKYAPIKENQVIAVLKKHNFDKNMVYDELSMVLSHLKEAEEDEDWVTINKHQIKD